MALEEIGQRDARQPNQCCLLRCPQRCHVRSAGKDGEIANPETWARAKRGKVQTVATRERKDDRAGNDAAYAFGIVAFQENRMLGRIVLQASYGLQQLASVRWSRGPPALFLQTFQGLYKFRFLRHDQPQSHQINFFGLIIRIG